MSADGASVAAGDRARHAPDGAERGDVSERAGEQREKAEPCVTTAKTGAHHGVFTDREDRRRTSRGHRRRRVVQDASRRADTDGMTPDGSRETARGGDSGRIPRDGKDRAAQRASATCRVCERLERVEDADAPDLPGQRAQDLGAERARKVEHDGGGAQSIRSANVVHDIGDRVVRDGEQDDVC